MIRDSAFETLNQYLSTDVARYSISSPSVESIQRQREAFLARFGPEALSRMSRIDLLREIPLNASSSQPMDYWLEFKNDEEFNYRYFGSISGGSASKYGVWQEKSSGRWMTHRTEGRGHHEISEDEALRILERRRAEVNAAVEVIRGYGSRPVEEIDPEQFQEAVMGAAPYWHVSAWFHKYLHLVFPNLVTWTSTKGWSKASLYRVGIEPSSAGMYARDIQTIRFWNSLPALQEFSVPVRYRAGKGLSPRSHWIIEIPDALGSINAAVDRGYLTLGSNRIGDLSGAASLSGKREIKAAVAAAARTVGVDEKDWQVRNLAEVISSIDESHIIAIASDKRTIIAVGEVTGRYRFVPNDEHPHQVPVRLEHTRAFSASVEIDAAGGLTMLPPTHPLVADIEASLVTNGFGPWPGFGDFIRSINPTSVASGAQGESAAIQPQAPLPPLEGVVRSVVDMLERKRQIILYGPPGTGKTYQAERVALEIVARRNFGRVPAELTPEQRDRIYGRHGFEPYIAMCTFHPMYAYEDFIEGYRPNGAGFALEDGIFKRIAREAHAEPTKTFVLIIDEINRGNIPKIFGELITLIETTKRGTTIVRLPLSKEPFTVPENLLIIGTMNTADRSILLLDTALRRRFGFKELLPEPHLLRSGFIGEVPLSAWLRALNRRIIQHLGRDARNLQIGHAYLMPNGKPAATTTRTGEIVREELFPLLQEYCYDDHRKVSSILAGDAGGIYDPEEQNLRFDLFEPGREDDLIQALTAIVTPEDITRDASTDEDQPDEEDPEERLGDTTLSQQDA